MLIFHLTLAKDARKGRLAKVAQTVRHHFEMSRLKAFLRYFFEVIGFICKWSWKICVRLRMLCILKNLENSKITVAAKVNRKYLQANKSHDDSLCYLLSFPFIWIYLICVSAWEKVSTTFMADKYGSYLSLMKKRDTRENLLLKMSLMFIVGVVTSTVFFYTQIYIMHRFDDETLYFGLFVLGMCTLGPLLSRWGKALSLLVIPITLTTTFRAIFYSILIMEVQRISWSNIDDNFDRTLKTITCTKTALVGFAKKTDFNYRDEGENSKEGASVNVNLDRGGLIGSIFKGWRRIKNNCKIIYRYMMYVVNQMLEIGKSISKFLADAIKWVWKNDVVRFIRCTLSVPIEFFLNILCDVIKGIGTLAKASFSQLIEMAKNLGNSVKTFIVDNMSAKYEANYKFELALSSNSSFREIFGKTKDLTLEKHFYIRLIKEAVLTFFRLWVVQAFIRIFGASLWYLILYMGVSMRDNLHITRAFYEYDMEMQRRWKKASLMPFYTYELYLYVPRKGVRLNVIEAVELLFRLFTDMYVVICTLTILLIDVLTYRMVVFTREKTIQIAADFVEPGINLVTESAFLQGLFTTNNKFMTDFKAMEDEIRQCSPRESPLDQDNINKGIWLSVVLLVLTFTTPYMDRTRAFICETYFPERIRARAMALYAHVKLQRVLFKIVVNLWMPHMKMILFQKGGQINPLENEMPPLDYEPKKPFLLFRIWPFSWITRKLTRRLSTCVKCPRKVDPFDLKTGLKCPNDRCVRFYCLQCYNLLKVRCEACGAEIRQANDADTSEESDSSGDEWAN